MALDMTKLDLVKHHNNNTIARCPACFELGQDHKGEHLIVNANGSFGCVVHQGDEGKAHRKRIFELVGAGHPYNKRFTINSIREKLATQPVLLKKDILNAMGHLGRDETT